jgi:hypothetical protein
MSNDRYKDFREGMAQRYGDPSMSGLRREPQNNRKNWSGWDNPSPSKKKAVVEQVLPQADQDHPQLKGWLDQL